VLLVPDSRIPDLSLVVPTYNERNQLEELVTSLFQVAAEARFSLEVVVVDDNSPDGTGALADRLASTRHMRVVHRPAKLGLGTAVMAGFGVATADILGVMDSDFSHPPSLVPRMLAVFREVPVDVLIASRYVPGGSTAGWPLGRRLLSRCGCLLARPISPVRDAASGFFLIRRDVVRDVEVKAGGFKIGLELIARSSATRLAEIPYRFTNRESGQSKMSSREAIGYLVQLWNLYGVRLRSLRRSTEYRRFTPAEVDAIVARAAARRDDPTVLHAAPVP